MHGGKVLLALFAPGISEDRYFTFRESDATGVEILDQQMVARGWRSFHGLDYQSDDSEHRPACNEIFQKK
jgi:hypothetical protein